MENVVYNDFTLSRVKELFLKDDIINLGDDFILARQNNNIDLQLLKYPSRINGFIAAYCKKGRFRCMINLKEYEIHDGMLVISIPDSIIQMTPVSPKEEIIELTVLAVSPQFMNTWRSDLNKIFIEAISVLKNPILDMLPEEVDLASNYFALIDKIIGSDTSYKMESIGYILTSIFYLIGGFVKKRVAETDSVVTSRHKKMFDMFLELVEKHHDKERMVSFYADKLCITPKYLSKIIKSVSGMSAPDIINRYVILEAQHLLRHTDKSIKQIADDLNFANQSFFQKYFKVHTGMTPNEYREK